MPITGSPELFEKNCPKVARRLTVHNHQTVHERDLKENRTWLELEFSSVIAAVT